MQIADIFERRIDRPIEEVIKVDALDDDIVLSEIEEYYPTPSIQEQMLKVLEAYAGTRQAPTGKVGVWVSGFFGAGKSSFAKLVGLLLESRKIGAQDTVDLFADRVSSDNIKVLLRQIREHLPTHVVVFDILKDQISGGGGHPVTMVMYKALLRSLGYPMDIDLAGLEIDLEESGQLESFQAAFEDLYPGKTWDAVKRLPMVAYNQASAALHKFDPDTYPSADSWAKTRVKAEISPRMLAEKALKLAEARAGGRNVVFVVDEIGQYTARDLSRIGDLQGVIESLGQVGQGKLWLICTSQEKLEQIVDIYERDRTELARLQDRFAHKVFLSPSDIREVASHRVLAKSGAAEATLRKLYQDHSGRLAQLTRVTGSVDLPELEEDAFVRLYPLLPYQVDLIISVVSGLRRQGSGPQTMGGANRTIIKLAQQLLIHESVGIGGQPVGKLVTLDSVFDLLSTSIATEIQQEIDDIKRQVQHPFAVPVAKALALLQFSEQVHTTEDNLAAVLHPAVDAPSLKPQVVGAIEALIKARKVRRTEQGLKIQSATERTWDEERDQRRPTQGDRLRIVKEQLHQLWGKPMHQQGQWKRFVGGLRVGEETLAEGEVDFQVRLLEAEKDQEAQIQDARGATQIDQSLITWVIEIDEDTERAIVERHRSEHMLRARTSARSPEEEGLLRDEKRRLDQEKRRIQDGLEKALCRGKIFFRGSDRSPGDGATDPKAEARRVLGLAVEQIYHRFGDGDVKVSRDDAAAILKNESLSALPDPYAELGVVRTVDGQICLVTDEGAAKDILDWIRGRCDMGQAPAGKELEQHFTSPPYGWGLELIQLIIGVLLRDGQVTVKAQGQTIKNGLSPEARQELTNNPRFRALTVAVRESRLEHPKVVAAGRALEERFGIHCPTLTPEGVAKVLREQLATDARKLEIAHQLLRELGLPGETPLGQALTVLRSVQGGDVEDAVLSFLENVETLAKALPRVRKISEELTEPTQQDLRRAILARDQVGPALKQQPEVEEAALSAVDELASHLAKETFYEQLPAIRTAADKVLGGFQALYDHAFDQRRNAYVDALEQLQSSSGWMEVPAEDRQRIAEPLQWRADEQPIEEPWRQAGHILGLLEEQRLAASALLTEALREASKILAPKAVEVAVRRLVNGPISSEEELEALLNAIREAAEQALAEGHSVVLV